MRSAISSTRSRSKPAERRSRPNIRALYLEEIQQWVLDRGFEPYRASQLAGWFYNRRLLGVDEMQNLPLALRDALVEDFDCRQPEVSGISRSTDGTTKMLIRLADGALIESVLIPREQRRTLCISSQVGCALGCRFCATAALGLVRNLEADEIVAQVLLAREVATPEPLTNYVFMGMGEPLANYERLLRAIRIMTARWGLGISPRRITVSTAGLVPQIERLVAAVPVHIAVSLTAPRDELRTRLMPINRRYPLRGLIDVCRRLGLPRRKRITFEYVLLDGINDGLREADELVRLFTGMSVKLNLIPFNSFPGSSLRASSQARAAAFQDRLLRAGIHTTIRKSRGQDIDAACGQLAALARGT